MNHPSFDRRSFLRRAGIATAATAFAPSAGLLLGGATAARADGSADIDADILNFALNLEYLEAEYYSYGVTGAGIDAQVDVTGSGTPGTTTVKSSSTLVPFATFTIQSYLTEIAADELSHVKFLRAALQGAGVEPVARPTINLLDSFNTLAQLAGLGNSFDPFADEDSFLLGGFIFEDVGVTAYHGAAALITSKDYLKAAAGILAVEAYHAGIIRTKLFDVDQASSVIVPGTKAFGDSPTLIEKAQAISDARDAVDNPKDKDQGIANADGSANIVPTNPNGLVYARGTRQILNIVYGGSKATSGLFFPAGMNGAIR